MIGFEQQMQFANILAKSFSDSTASVMQASTDFWSGGKKPDPARSWYRPPAANPFDLSAWGFPAPASVSPWTAWQMPYAMPTGPQAGHAWSALATFAQAMAAIQPAQAYWSSMIPGMQAPANPAFAAWQAFAWPAAQFTAMAAAVVAPSVAYSSYRSEGGHATAQITFPGETKPSWRSTRLH